MSKLEERRISDVIITTSGYYYRCNGRKLNVCSKCHFKFQCWTQFRGSYGIKGLVGGTERIVINIEDYFPFEKFVKGKIIPRNVILQALFGTTEGFKFGLENGNCDVMYKGGIFLEGAYRLG